MSGTDVFISYKREERERVRQIVDALKALDLSVWFDAKLETGSSFDEEINREVRGAKCVLVCWSPVSVASKWVRAEASIGMGRDVLAAVYLEPAELMPPYNLIHTVSLKDWQGAEDDPAWLDLVERIGKLCGRPGLRETSEQRGRAGRSSREEAKARREFEAALTEARNRFHAMHETRPAAFERDLAQASIEFERWLEARRAGRKANRPDPLALVESNSEVLRHDLEVSERERLAAVALVERYRAELQREQGRAPASIPTQASPLEAQTAGTRTSFWRSWRFVVFAAFVYVVLEGTVAALGYMTGSLNQQMWVQMGIAGVQLGIILIWRSIINRPPFTYRLLIFWPVFLIVSIVILYAALFSIAFMFDVGRPGFPEYLTAACIKLFTVALLFKVGLGPVLRWATTPKVLSKAQPGQGPV